VFDDRSQSEMLRIAGSQPDESDISKEESDARRIGA
jgi:hypothetical protein